MLTPGDAGDTLLSSFSLIRLAMVKDFFLGLSGSVIIVTGAGGDEDTGDVSLEDDLACSDDIF